MFCDRRPLAPRRKPRAPSTPQATLLEDIDESPASRRIRTEAALVLVDAFVSRFLSRSRDQSPADRGAQFSGPEVTSCPVIWPPLVRTVPGP
jgi:hypothetical protein